jgi:DtxR family Mn-dependent transcriptional regulator
MLEKMLELINRNGTLSPAEIARQLNVHPALVTVMLEDLQRRGLLRKMDPKKGTHLTPTGLEQAKTVMRRHMLAEWMLSKMLSWSKLHKEAHSMEHAISQEVEATLIDDLNQPELCPHGNPLPGHEAVVQDWIPLTNLSEGDQVVIRRIHELTLFSMIFRVKLSGLLTENMLYYINY